MRLVILLLLSASLYAESSDSIIFLTKNTNNNQVHYGLRLNDQCQPLDRKPVEAYWRMLEKGEDVREKLMFWEQPGYGVRQPESITTNGELTRFTFFIRGVPDRRIDVEIHGGEGKCTATAYTTIDGSRAVFQRIDIEVSGWANVHRVEIHGVNAVSNDPVSEVTHSE